MVRVTFFLSSLKLYVTTNVRSPAYAYIVQTATGEIYNVAELWQRPIDRLGWHRFSCFLAVAQPALWNFADASERVSDQYTTNAFTLALPQWFSVWQMMPENASF